MSSHKQAANLLDRLLGHWLCAVPVLLLVAGLSIAVVDSYALSKDAFISIINAGWHLEHSSLIDVVDSLQRNSPQQGPVYYLLLHVWGRLAGHELASARVLSIFFSLLTCCGVYRLARDIISPVAGFIAIVLLISNAFFAYFIAFVRMYSLVILLSTLALWLYLRLLSRCEGGRVTDYIALSFTCYAMLLTHAFSLLLFAAVGLVHLLVRPKDSNWVRVFVAALAALGLFILTVLSLETGAESNRVPNPATFWGIIGAWLAIVSNGSVVLLAITAFGLASFRRFHISRLPLLLAMLLVFIAMAGATSNFVSVGRVRYYLPGLPLCIVVLATGIYCWYRLRRLLGLLLLGAWLMTGWLFAQNTDWDDYLGNLDKSYSAPPWHIISREAIKSNPVPALVVFRPSNGQLVSSQHSGYSISDHYFGEHGILVKQVFEYHYLQDVVNDLALSSPLVWLVTQFDPLEEDTHALASTLMLETGFVPCSEKQLIADTTLSTFTWRDLQCTSPQHIASHGSSVLNYSFYGASIDARAATLRLRFRWSAEQDTENDWRISHQLLDEQHRNHAQIDLPLDHMGELRQYAIDLADVPPGDYRLMAIVYDAQTGERLAWHDNESWVPEMQQLAEITIPD